jgi:hypothetical protein
MSLNVAWPGKAGKARRGAARHGKGETAATAAVSIRTCRFGGKNGKLRRA